MAFVAHMAVLGLGEVLTELRFVQIVVLVHLRHGWLGCTIERHGGRLHEATHGARLTLHHVHHGHVHIHHLLITYLNINEDRFISQTHTSILFSSLLNIKIFQY